MVEKQSVRTCRDCGKTGVLKDFVTGRNLCLNCQAERQRRSRSKKRETMEFGDNTTPAKPIASDNALDVSSIFDNREALTAGLRQEFQGALKDAKELVDFNKDRLDKAKNSGDPESIEEASKALQRAASAHVGLISRLSEKLQGLDELAAKAEKAKPVTFFLLQPGKFPDLEAMRQISAEYYPDESQAANEVEFD